MIRVWVILLLALLAVAIVVRIVRGDAGQDVVAAAVLGGLVGGLALIIDQRTR